MHIKERGFITTWVFILLMLALTIALYLNAQGSRTDKVTNLRMSAPGISADTAQLIDEYKHKQSPAVKLSGMYRGSIHSDGNTLYLSYYFGTDNIITKTATIDKVTFNGSAKYRLQGSALIFSEIEGDKGLFYTQGEPFSVPVDGKLLFPASEPAIELTLER